MLVLAPIPRHACTHPSSCLRHHQPLDLALLYLCRLFPHLMGGAISEAPAELSNFHLTSAELDNPLQTGACMHMRCCMCARPSHVLSVPCPWRFLTCRGCPLLLLPRAGEVHRPPQRGRVASGSLCNREGVLWGPTDLERLHFEHPNSFFSLLPLNFTHLVVCSTMRAAGGWRARGRHPHADHRRMDLFN